MAKVQVGLYVLCKRSTTRKTYAVTQYSPFGFTSRAKMIQIWPLTAFKGLQLLSAGDTAAYASGWTSLLVQSRRGSSALERRASLGVHMYTIFGGLAVAAISRQGSCCCTWRPLTPRSSVACGGSGRPGRSGGKFRQGSRTIECSWSSRASGG
jgi:hypothetical protein